ncbi:MAG: carbohydrate kinase [Gemmatimonadetes bacterium]|nr:carbohydrate kinase [Gemmatimonadota bacterium]
MTRPLVVGIGEVLWDLLPAGPQFGGAPANVAMHAAALGAHAALVSAVGEDPEGREAVERLAASGVDSRAVARLPDRPTGVVRVTLDGSGQPSYDIATGSAWDAIPWSDAIAELVARADAVCFGSLAQRGPGSRGTVRRALGDVGRAAWRLFDVNLRQWWFDAEVLDTSLRLANAVKLNDEELPVVARLCDVVGDTPEVQLAGLMSKYGLALAALTAGPRGATLLTPTAAVAAPAPATRVTDTIGAGDAFTAALLVGLLSGASLSAVATRANAVAAHVCSQPGATPPIPPILRWS